MEDRLEKVVIINTDISSERAIAAVQTRKNKGAPKRQALDWGQVMFQRSGIILIV